ncbi:hypothetical protein ACLBWP_03465 [Microbacterium sp. M1A1_1b]
MSADWVAVVIAALAACVAIWQAVEARRARTDARDAAKEAGVHEQKALQASEDAASAAGRSASAQERIAEVVEAGAVKSPWGLRKKSPTVWRLRNVSDHPVRATAVFMGDSRLSVTPDDVVGGRNAVPRTVGPGEGVDVVFDYEEGSSSNTWAAFTVSWAGKGGEPSSEEFTLQWRPPARIIF